MHPYPYPELDSQLEWWPRAQTQEFLGISDKSLQRYAKPDRPVERQLVPTYCKNPNGGQPFAFYKAEEVRQFKDKMKGPLLPTLDVKSGMADSQTDNPADNPTDNATVNTTDNQTSNRSAKNRRASIPGNESMTFLMQFHKALTLMIEGQSSVKLLENGDLKKKRRGSRKPILPLSELIHKKLLSFDEAAALTGRPVEEIRDAKNKGVITAYWIGQGWKLTHPEIDKFTDHLITNSPTKSPERKIVKKKLKVE